MNERALMIKTALRAELIKEGKTLQDLEEHLAGLSKVANPIVDAAAGGWLTTKLGPAVRSLLNLYGSSALLAGGIGGTALYGIHAANESSDLKKMKALQEAQQYTEATKALQENMRQQPTI